MAFMNRGYVFGENGQNDAAIALAPNAASAFYGRGLARVQLGDRAGGESDIAHAKVLNMNIGK
jgi:hypothetical protein